MRELTVSEMNVVGGGMNFDEAGFGTILVGAGYTILALSPGGVVVAGVGLVTGFAGGFFIGDGLVNNGRYVEAFDQAVESDSQ